MNEYRLLVTTGQGGVVAVEYHAQAATANERATAYQGQGFVTVVTEGKRGADGTFQPANVGG